MKSQCKFWLMVPTVQKTNGNVSITIGLGFHKIHGLSIHYELGDDVPGCVLQFLAVSLRILMDSSITVAMILQLCKLLVTHSVKSEGISTVVARCW